MANVIKRVERAHTQKMRRAAEDFKYKIAQQDERDFIYDTEKRLGLKTLDGWYQISQKTFRKGGHLGYKIIRNYDTSLQNVIKHHYPMYKWLPWKFLGVPTHFWQSLSNQTIYIREVEAELNIKKVSDWYKVHVRELYDMGASRLINHYYGGSLGRLLEVIYCDYVWIPWKFTATRRYFWSEQENLRSFIRYAEQKLNIRQINDWYNVTASDFGSIDRAGAVVRSCGMNSYKDLLVSLYPQYNWIPWKFTCISRNFWKSQQNIREFVEYVKDKMDLNTIDECKRVSSDQLRRLGCVMLQSSWNDVLDSLRNAEKHKKVFYERPSHIEERMKRSEQWWLSRCTFALFPT